MGKPKPFFIVWSPTSPGHGVLRYEERSEAGEKAALMVKDYPSHEFYVMQARDVYRAITVQHIELEDETPFD